MVQRSVGQGQGAVAAQGADDGGEEAAPVVIEAAEAVKDDAEIDIDDF